jgi:hypothetical protein
MDRLPVPIINAAEPLWLRLGWNFFGGDFGEVEAGAKKPSAAALKLLAIVQKHGLQILA